ncbi:hypothetical protein RSJ42_00440 [Methanosarcina hadiensis]|uniref:hypothetical protein n=1 Tax=Methanosarcina hadiensis TaxID=3078083 RepID=UPI00397739FA
MDAKVTLKNVKAVFCKASVNHHETEIALMMDRKRKTVTGTGYNAKNQKNVKPGKLVSPLLLLSAGIG